MPQAIEFDSRTTTPVGVGVPTLAVAVAIACDVKPPARVDVTATIPGWKGAGVTPYDVVRLVLALALLLAAALKGYQLATSPVAEADVFSSRLFLIAVVEFELCLGFWLLGGQFARQTRYVAIGCFGLFGAVSVFRALRGDSSCGCFGAVPVSPWLTTVLDGAAVLALVVSRHHALPPPTLPRCLGNHRFTARRHSGGNFDGELPAGHACGGQLHDCGRWRGRARTRRMARQAASNSAIHQHR